MPARATVEIVVAGAGVVGLAVARALALAGHQVLILDRERQIGTGISSRNSEVIHAGLYYPEGSLKALSCVEGRGLLYRYCAERGVTVRRLGKLIVATEAPELPLLERVAVHAAANGVSDLAWLDAKSAQALEPALSCVGALFSPSTGIVDSHALMLAYLGDAEAAGALFIGQAPIDCARVADAGLRLEIGGAEQISLDCSWLINCAGLAAPALAGTIDGMPPQAVPQAAYCKGSYFSLSGRSPFSHLIYPVPEQAGLGVHLTLDLGGQARFGPDVEWVAAPNYDVEIARAAGFYGAIRRYWPGLPDGALQPGYAGIRPKLGGPGQPAADFRLDGPAAHGIAGLINLFGIESPGLTASLALAERVRTMVAAQG